MDLDSSAPLGVFSPSDQREADVAAKIVRSGHPILISVVGAGHSGSSLFDALVGGHSRISGLGEVQRISDNPTENTCGCGRTINACPFWEAVTATIEWPDRTAVGSLADHPITLLGDTGHRRLSVKLQDAAMIVGSRRLLRAASVTSSAVKRLREIATNSWLLFDTVSGVDGTDVVLDTSKDSRRIKYLYLEQPRRTRVIHLVRDGRGVVASHKKRGDLPLEAAARMWNNRNAKAELMLATIPQRRRMRVRYEDLCTDVEATLEKIWQFVGLSREDGLGRSGTKELHAIPGNPAFYARRDRAVQLDEAWKRLLDTEHRAAFDRIAGRRNRRYGYE